MCAERGLQAGRKLPHGMVRRKVLAYAGFCSARSAALRLVRPERCGYHADMTKAPSRSRPAGLPPGRSQARAARLAAALKANLQRRKIQARSRAAEPDEIGRADGAHESDGPHEQDQTGEAEGPTVAPHIGAAIVEDKRTG
jgi:hypothetical protein